MEHLDANPANLTHQELILRAYGCLDALMAIHQKDYCLRREVGCRIALELARLVPKQEIMEHIGRLQDSTEICSQKAILRVMSEQVMKGPA
jgi:hypothetical protein